MPSKDATRVSARASPCSWPRAAMIPSTSVDEPGPPGRRGASASSGSRGRLQRQLQLGQQQLALVEPAQEERARSARRPGRPSRGQSAQVLGERRDVGGERARDVLGERGLQGLAGAEVRRAAALGQPRPAVHGAVGQPAQALLGDDVEGGLEQLAPTRAQGDSVRSCWPSAG